MNSQIIKILLFAILTATSAVSNAQVIPPNRTVDWGVVLETFDFQYHSNEISVADFGATGDGITDDRQAVADAILSLDDEGGVVIFPNGTYLFNSSIQLKQNVVLRGNSSDSSVLLFDLGQAPVNCIVISAAQNEEFGPLLGGFEKGSQKLLSSFANTFVDSEFAEIVQDNGDWDISPASWAQNVVGQIVRIDKVEGDTIFIDNTLRISYDENLNPRIRPIFPIENVAVECLKIKRIDEPEEGAGSNIYFNFSANCKVKGVESDSSVGAHISINYSTNIKITGNYIHHAFTYDGSGTRGYGVKLSQHSGECYIANNIFKHLRHAMMVKTGSNGNIFSYNYSIEPFRSEPISDLSGDISLHGHYAFLNLFEGNIIQNIIIDHYWGPSGSYNTLFRNRAELFGILMTTHEELETTYQNFVGNETTKSQVFYGQYTLTGTNHFEYGNNILGNTVPSGTSELNDASYYINEPPYFWNEDIPWPSVGYPNGLGEYSIPAKQRYVDGGVLTVCIDSVLTSMSETEIQKLKLWPNPANETVNLRVMPGVNNRILITDLQGRKVITEDVFSLNETYQINLPKIKTTSFLIISVENTSGVFISKLLVNKH